MLIPNSDISKYKMPHLCFSFLFRFSGKFIVIHYVILGEYIFFSSVVIISFVYQFIRLFVYYSKDRQGREKITISCLGLLSFSL